MREIQGNPAQLMNFYLLLGALSSVYHAAPLSLQCKCFSSSLSKSSRSNYLCVFFQDFFFHGEEVRKYGAFITDWTFSGIFLSIFAMIYSPCLPGYGMMINGCILSLSSVLYVESSWLVAMSIFLSSFQDFSGLFSRGICLSYGMQSRWRIVPLLGLLHQNRSCSMHDWPCPPECLFSSLLVKRNSSGCTCLNMFVCGGPWDDKKKKNLNHEAICIYFSDQITSPNYI